MKQSGQCPKCDSTSIWDNSHIEAARQRKAGTRRWILVQFKGMFGLTRQYAIKDEYVCMNCGYTESFVDEKGLQTIRRYGFPDREQQ